MNEDKYSYINTKGNLVSNTGYDTTSEYDENGYAIVSNNDTYGVINSNGKEEMKSFILFISIFLE